MARYFFDATSDDFRVTDFHGRDIDHKDEVRPAMLDAVRAIRTFLGEELASEAWALEVRLGESNRIASMSFDEVEAAANPTHADVLSPLAA
jgi:hypothetical protein